MRKTGDFGNRLHYEAPELELMLIGVEQGFSISNYQGDDYIGGWKDEIEL